MAVRPRWTSTVRVLTSLTHPALNTPPPPSRRRGAVVCGGRRPRAHPERGADAIRRHGVGRCQRFERSAWRRQSRPRAQQSRRGIASKRVHGKCGHGDGGWRPSSAACRRARGSAVRAAAAGTCDGGLQHGTTVTRPHRRGGVRGATLQTTDTGGATGKRGQGEGGEQTDSMPTHICMRCRFANADSPPPHPLACPRSAGRRWCRTANR